ncbi:MAG: M23 family metallopeptidase [Chloroflexi bacterium]|nr:M23 family metallopeptidase [Chloroflexota bacterium]
MTRRRMVPSARAAFSLLLTFVLLLVAACSGGSEGAPNVDIVIRTATPTVPPPTATVTPSPSPSPSPTPQPASVRLVRGLAVQGGLFLVRLVNPPPAQEVHALFAGGSYPMLADGDRWFAVIGLRTDFPPGDYPVEVLADGDSVGSTVLNVAPTNFPQENIELPPDTAGLLSDAAAIEKENNLLASVYGGYTGARFWSGAWVMPAQGPVTNSFGLLRSINGGAYFPHSGTDIAAEPGSPVVATAGGRVVLAAKLYLRGKSVVIDHGAGVFSGYHHLSKLQVTEGDEVGQGQQIGLVGSSGLASGPHLHWEVRIGGVLVDPVLWTLRPVEP